MTACWMTCGGRWWRRAGVCYLLTGVTRTDDKRVRLSNNCFANHPLPRAYGRHFGGRDRRRKRRRRSVPRRRNIVVMFIIADYRPRVPYSCSLTPTVSQALRVAGGSEKKKKSCNQKKKRTRWAFYYLRRLKSRHYYGGILLPAKTLQKNTS